MNVTLVSAFLRHRLASPGRLVLLFLIFAFPLATVAATKGALGIQPLGNGWLFALVLGAGMIGGDVSSGVLQLLFARPVSRFEYLTSRWLAVGLGATAVAVLQVALGGAILAAAGTLGGWYVPARFAIEQGLEAFAFAAVIACFSSVLPGVGDVFALLASKIMVSTLLGAATFAKQRWTMAVLDGIDGTLFPHVSWTQTFAGGHVSWLPIVSLASTVTLALSLAAVALNRREISYASSD